MKIHEGDRANGLLNLSKKNRKSNHFQMSKQRQHILLCSVRPWLLLQSGARGSWKITSSLHLIPIITLFFLTVWDDLFKFLTISWDSKALHILQIILYCRNFFPCFSWRQIQLTEAAWVKQVQISNILEQTAKKLSD